MSTQEFVENSENLFAIRKRGKSAVNPLPTPRLVQGPLLEQPQVSGQLTWCRSFAFQDILVFVSDSSQNCRTVLDTEYKTSFEQECSTIYEDQCSTSYEKSCFTVPDTQCQSTQTCEPVEENRCKTVNMVVQCEKVFIVRCSDVTENCEEILRVECKEVPKEICKKVPRQQCSSVPVQKPVYFPKEICD